ncbi:MAG: ComF family protein [Lachnospiraceae bacterium]|nr:ComF family protein [Lachnospiraceae bacterium]
MLEWLYPTRCPVCEKPVLPKGAMIHSLCENRLPVLSEPFCKKCGKPLASEDEEYCPVCMVKNRVWDGGRSVYRYQNTAGSMIRKVKRDGTETILVFLAKQMKSHCRSFLLETGAECIVPVPLHWTKQQKRGFNQAELLARALGKELGIPVKNLLQKTKHTKDQKYMSLEQRSRNVADVYCIRKDKKSAVMPQAVLLIDDIVTTGSTLTACAGVLKESGVKQVYFITVCAGE